MNFTFNFTCEWHLVSCNFSSRWRLIRRWCTGQIASHTGLYSAETGRVSKWSEKYTGLPKRRSNAGRENGRAVILWMYAGGGRLNQAAMVDTLRSCTIFLNKIFNCGVTSTHCNCIWILVVTTLWMTTWVAETCPWLLTYSLHRAQSFLRS